MSNDCADDVVGCACGKHSGEFDTLSDRPAKRNRGIMNTGSSKSPDRGAWRDLYKAALFEIDKIRLGLAHFNRTKKKAPILVLSGVACS
jgi:hypothetical protein